MVPIGNSDRDHEVPLNAGEIDTVQLPLTRSRPPSKRNFYNKLTAPTGPDFRIDASESGVLSFQ